MGHHQSGSDSCCGGSCCSTKGCGCGTSSCGSSCGSQHGDCHSGKECDIAQKFIQLADEAWMEVLKEKIKDQIRSSDHKIEELAKIISEANRDRWQRKMTKKKSCEEFKDKLNSLFCSGESCQKGSNPKGDKW